MINIVLPIAGRGSRFAEEGFKLPKPLINVHEKPMIEVVVNNIRPDREHRFIFVALKDHLDHLGMKETLNRIAPGCIIIPVTEVTQGAACTVLLAQRYIDNNDQLMIANSDQWVNIDINNYLSIMDDKNTDGLIMTMWADDPKWSFVGLCKDGNVNKVVEKEVISNEATVGIYNFRKGSDFVMAANQMIVKNLRVNNEFYVAPAYNEMISNEAKISIYNIGKEYDGMYGMGIPSDLEKFVLNPVSKNI
ncbi:MAG: glycosyl transferase family 2 [Flavobacteriaceae bacterium]|nr:glycosyl transferase family 2 [Flavobacteriaceae bacterium]|tara:strand:+ start:13939 stop:14682 length:744 start_codon:yes stop_codon:yes gene_type:complete